MRKEKFELTLRTADVRQFCINNQYYTCGDCRAYSNMFDMFYAKNVTPTLLRKVAQDIKDHSDTEDTADDIAYYLTAYLRVDIVKA